MLVFAIPMVTMTMIIMAVFAIIMIIMVIVILSMFAMTNDNSYNNNDYNKSVVLFIFSMSLVAICWL